METLLDQKFLSLLIRTLAAMVGFFSDPPERGPSKLASNLDNKMGRS